MMSPYDKLKSLPNAQSFLKPSISLNLLDEFASNSAIMNQSNG
jgi:hypothetical protein